MIIILYYLKEFKNTVPLPRELQLMSVNATAAITLLYHARILQPKYIIKLYNITIVMIIISFYHNMCRVSVECRGHIERNNIQQHDLRFIFNRQKPFEVIIL